MLPHPGSHFYQLKQPTTTAHGPRHSFRPLLPPSHSASCPSSSRTIHPSPIVDLYTCLIIHALTIYSRGPQWIAGIQFYLTQFIFLLLFFSTNYLPTFKNGEVKWSEVKSLSRVRLFATPWTIAYQAPPSMGFSRQECWSGLPFPSPKYWSNRPQTLLFPPNKLQASQEPPGLVYKPVYTIASAIILWNIIK